MYGNLPFGQGLGEDVGCHVICRAIDERNGVVGDDLADEMVADVDVFCPCMVVVFNGEFDSCLVVAIEGSWGRRNGE